MGSNHEKKNLKKISQQIIKLFYDHQQEEFNLEQISIFLNIDKRKIYDLVNILTTLGLISKVTKGVYKWIGVQNCKNFLNNIPTVQKSQQKFQEEKSLSSLTVYFLSMLKSNKKLNQDDLSNKIENLDQTNKSKVRRIHDVTKIFLSLNLILQKEDDKQTTYFLNDLSVFFQELDKVLECESIDITKIRENTKMQQLQSEFLNNMTQAIFETGLYKQDKEVLLRKRRTSSFDPNIADVYLNKEEVVLPHFSLPKYN